MLVTPMTQPLSPVQTAASLFAEGLEHEAQRQLQSQIEDPTAGARPEPWRALLDLMRLMGNRERFDRIATNYAKRFEQPTPPWDPLVNENRLLPELRDCGAAFIQISGDLDVADAIALNAHDILSQHAVVRMDGSCLRSLDQQACSVLLDTINRALDAGGGVYLTGVTRWVQCVAQLIRVHLAFQPAWQLLLKLWQLKGEEREFKRIATEYALGFGSRAPEWESIVAPRVDIPEVEEKREAPRYSMGSEIMRIVGTVAGSQSFYLRELQNFALDRKYVNVDLSLLHRMDALAARGLVLQVNALIGEGKVVRLLRQHSLVHTLLQLQDINASVVCTALTR